MAEQVFPGTHGKAHGGAVECFLTGSVAHGKLMLEQDLPEELQPMGRTHSATGVHTAAHGQPVCEWQRRIVMD